MLPRSAVPERAAAYAGRDFRAYPSMRVGDAGRFYAALRPAWDTARFAELCAAAGLGAGFSVGRMKRAFGRALVLAIASASGGDGVLVVEGGEEFDEPGAVAGLARALELHRDAVVTFAGDVPEALAPGFDRIAAAPETRA